MPVATRSRRHHRHTPAPPAPRHTPPPPGVLADALLREHADVSAMLGSSELMAGGRLTSTLHALSSEARAVARSLTTDGDVAPAVPADAPTVVLLRDLAVAQRALRRALTPSTTAASCDRLARSLARVAELRDIVGDALEGAPPA